MSVPAETASSTGATPASRASAGHTPEMNDNTGKLYLVSTPIGNLADISGRALETLRTSDLVLAEDTRRTRILLEHYEITPQEILSFHEHNARARAEEARGLLAGGGSIALVSDAGTPLVSDPGLRLVRAAIDAGARVVPIPGASAVLAALVGSGLEPEPFTFIGFLPRSGRDRDDWVERLRTLDHTVVFFESPQRLVATLEELAEELEEGRNVAVARELTKVHEEFIRGTLREAAAYYRKSPPRGEVVVCLSGAPTRSPEEAIEEARSLARSMARSGATSREIVDALGARFGFPRNRAYALALEMAEESEA